MLLSSLAALGASRRLAGDAAKPNFLVFFVDDLGIDQVAVPKPSGFVGYTGNGGTISTPNVAKLASEGMLFQSFYASFHVCSPSRASSVPTSANVDTSSKPRSRTLTYAGRRTA